MGRLTLVGDINGDGYTDFSDSGCTTGTGVADCRDGFNLTNAVGGNAFNSLIDINLDGRADWVYAADNGEFKAVLSDYNGTDGAITLGQVDWTDIAAKSAKPSG